MKLVQSGPRNARIVIVGESPGANEEREGTPFVGGSGVLLTQMLNRAGISRDECFITNICHKMPPKNEFRWFMTKEGQPHLIGGLMQLKADLLAIRPNLVIALGTQPLKVLAGKDGITDWRGSILPSTLATGLKVIGTYHPAAILRQWDYKCVAEFDLARCAAERLHPEIVYPKRDFYLPEPDSPFTVRHSRIGLDWVNTGEHVDRKAIIAEMLQAPSLAVDIECWQNQRGGWDLACVGFSDRPDRALVIKVDGPGSLNDIRELCLCPALKVMQNGIFDTTVLHDCGIEVNNFNYDTMLAHHALYAESAGGGDEVAALTGKKRSAALAKGLAFQTSIYTREPYYKADGKLWKETGDLSVFWRYNALDACCTKEIEEVQQPELRSFGVLDIFTSAVQLMRPIMDATRHGIRIDMETRERMKVDISKQADNLQTFIDNTVGYHLNVKSNKQMVELLYDKLKLPMRKGKSGNPTADKDTLVELGQKSMNPVLQSIILLRQKRDLIERYLDAPVDPDLRMRCSFDITGTRSGRLSSRASLTGSGTNLQNIPEEMRQMFVADPGKAFVYRDYSQAEARVVAYQSRCHGLIELFEDPSRDIHAENAARIFGHKSAVLEKDGGPVTAAQRYLAKRVVHACNYGMAAPRLVEIVNEDAAATGIRITLQQARQLIERYFLLYPEIQQNFWREVEHELHHTRTLDTPFHRRRMFFARWDDKLLREAYSYVPQSTCGDMGRKAWINIADRLRDRPALGALCLLNVHDSLLVQCNEDAIPETVSLMRESMIIPVELNGYTFTIPTDCKVGYNWGNFDKKNPDHNPRGLKEYKE